MNLSYKIEQKALIERLAAANSRIASLTQRNQELEKHAEVSELRELWLKEQRNHMIGAFSAVKDLGDKYVDEKIRLDDKAIEELSNMKKKASIDREK